jgi:hypothetical protein
MIDRNPANQSEQNPTSRIVATLLMSRRPPA